jgi:hypothetical protein
MLLQSMLQSSVSVSENGRKCHNPHMMSRLQGAQFGVGIYIKGDSPKFTISGTTQAYDIWRAKSQTAIIAAISGIDAHTSCMNLKAWTILSTSLPISVRAPESFTVIHPKFSCVSIDFGNEAGSDPSN